jgi:cysteine desulfurase/selenocysteine lyase
VRGFLNAPSTDEIIFTRNLTDAANLVASSFGMDFKAGDEIVLSIMEHHSNIVPWHFLRERKGAVLKWAPIADDGTFLIDEFEKLLTPRTKIVALTHMSNVLGTVVPIKEVIRLAHARGIPVFVDGAQAAVHMPVDVQDLDCDFYAFTGHKTYGPTGIGVLYAKRKHLDAMPPYQGGGDMIESVHTDRITYGKPPHKFEAGTPAIVQAIGLGAALDYMLGIGRDNIARHEHELKEYAHGRLAQLNWLKIHGQAKDKGAIVSFSMDGVHPHDISTYIDRMGVAVRAGHHCAQPLMDRLGVTATCRASLAMYNTKAEVDALAEALIKARAFFA